jgi:hypothetical protein
MEPDSLTEEKFQAVTGYSLEELKLLTSSPSFEIYKGKFKKEDFLEVLEGGPFEAFSEHLYYFLLIARWKYDRFVNNWSQRLGIQRQDLLFRKELALSLKELFTGGSLEFTITNLEKPHIIRDPKIVRQLQAGVISNLEEAIRSTRMNFVTLSKEEVIRDINTHADVLWIKAWMESMGYLDPDYESFTLSDFDEYFTKLGMSDALPDLKNKLFDALISEYASDHSYEEGLTVQSLERILNDIGEVLSKRGPKQVTIEEKRIAFILSVILRLDSYLKDDQVEKITDIEIKNKDLRYIHNVMTFIGFIEDYRRARKTEKSLEKRIRKMIMDYIEPDDVGDIIEKLQILKDRCVY